jgi:hypothetical protein
VYAQTHAAWIRFCVAATSAVLQRSLDIGSVSIAKSNPRITQISLEPYESIRKKSVESVALFLRFYINSISAICKDPLDALR